MGKLTSEIPNLSPLDAAKAAPPLTPEEAEKIIAPEDPWTDQRAKEFVKKTFNRYETFRIQNYDRAYRRADDVYMAVTRNKTWEGTRIPRASIPVWMGVQQIEALLPHAVGALFADDYPFECFPAESSTTIDMARAVRDLLRNQMDDLNPDVMGMTLREITRRAYKSDYVYGVAPVEFGWQMSEKRRLLYSRKAIPEKVPMKHPQTGEVIMVPSGQLKWTVDRQTKTYQISRPKVQNIEVQDYFFDPNLKSHNPQEGQGIATRQLLPISFLKQVCLPEFGYKLPSEKDWKELAASYKQTMAEVSKSWSEMDRGNYWNPSLDQNADPADARIEVVRFWNGTRHVWLFGREWVAYNWPNELGIIPFLNPFYIDVIGRHVGLSICDLIEGDQKLAQAIIEARIDELNLMVHPPIITKLGFKQANAQRRLRPGINWEVEDMSQAPQRMEMGNVTAAAYVEVQALEQRVQKTTGVTDLAALGSPSSGGNSANRTATGVNTQVAATGIRIQYQVENGEDQFVMPLLKMLLLLNQKYQDPEQPKIPVSLPDGTNSEIDPLDILNASIRFKLKASDKLRIRRMLASGGLDAVLQFIAGVQQNLMTQGLTCDWKTAGQLISDAIGLPDNTLIRQMTQPEAQAFQQQMQMNNQAKMMLQGQRMSMMSEMSESRDDTKLIGDVIKKLLTPEVVAKIAEMNGAPEVLDLLKKKVAPKPVAGK